MPSPTSPTTRSRSTCGPVAFARSDREAGRRSPIETALAGIPGLEYTRSLNRNGFAQITAVFSDKTDIYFARPQVAERLRTAEEALPQGVIPEMGPIATGLGDIFMWTVEYRELDQVRHRNGEPGLQRDGSYITPEGDHLVSDADKATYLRTVQDWIVTPQLKSTAGAGRRRLPWRLRPRNICRARTCSVWRRCA